MIARKNLNLLNTIIERDKCIILLANYTNTTLESRIDFICNCGQPHTKSLRRLNGHGAQCKTHQYKKNL